MFKGKKIVLSTFLKVLWGKVEASPRTIRIKNISYITFSKSYNTPSAHSWCLPHTRGHRYCICSTKVIWAQGKLCPRYLIPERYQQTKQSFLFLAAADVPGIREAEKKLRKKKNIQHVRVVSATRKINPVQAPGIDQECSCGQAVLQLLLFHNQQPQLSGLK